MVVGVYAVANTSWNETQVTWNTKPASSGGPLGTFTVLDNVSRTYTVDLSSYVQAQRGGGATLISLELRMPTSQGTYVIVNSREAALNPPSIDIQP